MNRTLQDSLFYIACLLGVAGAIVEGAAGITDNDTLRWLSLALLALALVLIATVGIALRRQIRDP